MGFPLSISAAQFSAVTVTRVAPPATSTFSASVLAALFNGQTTSPRADYVEIPGIRDMPSFGTPANIVKVPLYGQAQTQSIGAQSDAPDLEFTINFVPGVWQKSGTAFQNNGQTLGTGTLGDAVGDGINKVFQVALLTAKPNNLNTTAGAGGIGTVPNALIYFVGKIESLLINPARDDAMTATVALSIQSDFFGPYTI